VSVEFLEWTRSCHVCNLYLQSKKNKSREKSKTKRVSVPSSSSHLQININPPPPSTCLLPLCRASLSFHFLVLIFFWIRHNTLFVSLLPPFNQYKLTIQKEKNSSNSSLHMVLFLTIKRLNLFNSPQDHLYTQRKEMFCCFLFLKSNNFLDTQKVIRVYREKIEVSLNQSLIEFWVWGRKLLFRCWNSWRPVWTTVGGYTAVDGRQVDGGWRVVDVELQIGDDEHEPERVQFLSFWSVFSCKKKGLDTWCNLCTEGNIQTRFAERHMCNALFLFKR